MTTPREAAWQEFVDWCGARGLSAMPANPWTVAAYIRWLEHRASPTAIKRILRAIAQQHREKSRKRPERHPMVGRTLRGVETRSKERRRRRKEGPSLFPEDELVPAKAAEKKKTASKGGKKATAKKAEKKATKKAKKKDTAEPAAGKAARTMRQTPPLVRKRKVGS